MHASSAERRDVPALFACKCCPVLSEMAVSPLCFHAAARRVKKTTTCKSGIFLNHYGKRTTEYVTSHKAVKNGWKLKITSIENLLFLTLSYTWIYKMPLLVSVAITDIYTAYVFKKIMQANKTLFGCKCLVLKNLKQNPPLNKNVFKKHFMTRMLGWNVFLSTVN